MATIGPSARSFRTATLEPPAPNERNQKRAPVLPGLGDDTSPIPPNSVDSATPVSVAVESTAAVAGFDAVSTSVNRPPPAGLIASFNKYVVADRAGGTRAAGRCRREWRPAELVGLECVVAKADVAVALVCAEEAAAGATRALHQCGGAVVELAAAGADQEPGESRARRQRARAHAQLSVDASRHQLAGQHGHGAAAVAGTALQTLDPRSVQPPVLQPVGPKAAAKPGALAHHGGGFHGRQLVRCQRRDAATSPSAAALARPKPDHRRNPRRSMQHAITHGTSPARQSAGQQPGTA